LTGARYQFTPIFFANSTAQISGSPVGSDTGTVRTRVGVGQLLKTGGRLSVALANDLLHYFAGKPEGVERDSAINVLSVDLAQPLLRGFGINDPTVENLTQAERNVVYAVRSFSRFQEQFDIAIVGDYFNLLGQKANVRNNYTNYLRRVELTQYTEARAVDRVRAADVEDARTAELAARISYINSVAFYENQLDAFKLRLGVPLSDEIYLEDADLTQLEKLGLMPVPLDSDAAFRIALHENLDLLNSVDRFEDIKRRVRIAADQLKPGVNLFANASLQSEPPDDYLNFDPDNVRYSVGISLDNIVDRFTERNNYRATLVSFESQLRILVAALDSLRDRIERGFRTLEQQRQNVLNRQASLAVATRRVEMNETLHQAGRVQVRDLREAQDALIAAQNQLTDSVVGYLEARLQLLFDIGILKTDTAEFWLWDPVSGHLRDQRIEALTREASADQVLPPNQILEPLP
jgi:outer membrane protein TolC